MKYYTITVNGKVYEVTVEEGITGNVQPSAVSAQPVASAASAVSAAAKKNTTSAGNVKVNAPMPGKILAVKADEGQMVKRGDVLLVLEAMKMENEIVAPEDGTVPNIHVNVGNMVEAGDLLLSLD